jgi:hypothetical protein
MHTWIGRVCVCAAKVCALNEAHSSHSHETLHRPWDKDGCFGHITAEHSVECSVDCLLEDVHVVIHVEERESGGRGQSACVCST